MSSGSRNKPPTVIGMPSNASIPHFYKNVKQKPPHRLSEKSEGVMRWFVFLMLFRGFQLPQIAAQKGVKAAHCLLPFGVAVQL